MERVSRLIMRYVGHFIHYYYQDNQQALLGHNKSYTLKAMLILLLENKLIFRHRGSRGEGGGVGLMS